MFWADQFNESRIPLLALEGTLGRSDLMSLAERIRGLAAQGVSRIVLDARKVDHWDYRGLGALAAASVFCRRRRTGLAVVTSNAYLRDIAAAAGVLDQLDIYDDLDLHGPAVRLTVVRGGGGGGQESLRKVSGR